MPNPIDYNALTRSEFVALVRSRDETIASQDIAISQMHEQIDALQAKLLEHEGVQEDINEEFEKRWAIYERKGNKQSSLSAFKRMTKAQIKVLDDHMPRYKKANPEKKYRKDFEKYINKKCYYDQILEEEKQSKPKRSHPSYQPFVPPKEHDKLREANKLGS